MGRIIQKNNGMTTIFTSGEDISLITGQPDTYVLGIDPNTGLYEKLNPDGVTVDLEKDSSGITGGTLSGTTLILDNSGGGNINISLSGLSTGGGISSNLYEVTYSGLTTHISNSTLSGGSYYMITDFATIYDRPDYFINGNAKSVGSVNTYTGMTEPIIVLATSENTLSVDAYQPNYPKDKIKYDWSWSNTEINGTPTYGRISERIDEYENRTDYDHRWVGFVRYQGYETGTTLTGTINEYDCTTGVMLGNGTLFTTELGIGSIILLDTANNFGYQVGVKVVNIIDDVTMNVVIDSGYTSTIFTIGYGYNFNFYTLNATGSYYDYKEVYIGQRNENDYSELATFILDGGSLSNYIGDYSVFYINGAYSNSGFLLANNVFGSNSYSNTIGDRSFNNTTWSWFVRNDIAGRFYNNKITSGFYSNDIGEYFYDNKINGQFWRNTIGEDFYENITYNDFQNNFIQNSFNNNKIYDNFYENKIGNAFNDNVIYNRFYENLIGEYYGNNILGDNGNIGNWNFYRNDIGNNFENNNIRQEYQNNVVGNNHINNTTNGEFKGNTILNGFNKNNVGYGFNLNNIGNGFNTNTINDYFSENTTEYYFYNNTIANQFYSNKIGSYFQYNTSLNLTYGWNDLSNVSTRTYDTFRNSLSSNIGNFILGKELVMRVISTSQYFIIKFNQWTQGANGGGFSYERTEIDSSGGILGPTISFTKVNYGSEIDIIVPGILEITRGNQYGIYNVAIEPPPTSNGWPGPGDTEWNSVYTEPNVGSNFGYNKIGHSFTNNRIGDGFGYGFGLAQGNVIGDNFNNNIIGQYCYNNVIGNFFETNTIGVEFEHNQIQNYFIGNTIGTGFTSNQIGNYFGNNGSAGAMIQNNIFNDFKYNKIGNFFGNDTNFPIIGGGTNGDGGNIIGDGFQYNEIGDNFIWNLMDLSFTNNKIGDDFWFNAFGLYTNDNVIGNLFVANDGGGLGVPMGDSFISNKLGNYSGFNVIGANFKNNEIGDFFGNSGIGLNNDIAANFNNNKIGNYFGNDGTTTAGGNIISIKFYDNLIGNQFFSNTINQNIGLDAEFLNNKIGNGFNYNTTNGWFYDNQIGNGFNSNPDISDYFNSNTIGNDFNSNPYIGYSFYNNIINDYFESNNIGQDFHYNTIDPSFNNNTTTTNFNSNKIKTQISSIDFTDFYGNLTGFTYSALGSSAADNTYYGLYQDSTTGIGVNASFDIEVSGGVVIGVTGITQGKLYAISNTLTILGSQIIGTDGVDDVVITVTGISQLPSVYESYTCDIFERQGGTKRLSYYDSSDILTITNINE